MGVIKITVVNLAPFHASCANSKKISNAHTKQILNNIKIPCNTTTRIRLIVCTLNLPESTRKNACIIKSLIAYMVEGSYINEKLEKGFEED